MDVITDADLGALVAAHERLGPLATLAVNERETSRYLLFDERGTLRLLVNVYVDGTDSRFEGGMERPLAGGETLRIVQAVAGG